MKTLTHLVLALGLLAAPSLHAEEDHEAEGGIPPMSAERRAALGIQTGPAGMRLMAEELTAPGEVTVNRYRTAEVSPRITGQVTARHARMGQRVQRGQPLVTLSSVRMAEAQGELLISDREWRRVQRLGSKVVSEKRYLAAQVARQQAYATVLAYGMTEAQAQALLRQGDVSRATGTFDLLSPQAGTVLSDDFVVGRVVQPGQVLMEISDESRLWVEARLAPEIAIRIEPGSPARVSGDGRDWVSGKVIQIHRRLDETTRTLAVRIELEGAAGRLRPGQFVEAAIQTSPGRPVLAVPTEAVVLLQGDDVVFRAEGETIRPVPVERGVTRGGWTEIRAGLAEGEEVVTRGAYVLKSLLLKSQLGDEH